MKKTNANAKTDRCVAFLRTREKKKQCVCFSKMWPAQRKKKGGKGRGRNPRDAHPEVTTHEEASHHKASLSWVN
jgi:hypothetical protein